MSRTKRRATRPLQCSDFRFAEEMFWRRIVRVKYRHKTDRSLPPLIASAPSPSIPGTLIAPALAGQIIADKYEDHLPHYRQSKRFKRRHGIDIGRQTLNTWTHATLRHAEPVGEAVRDELLEAAAMQIDETPVDYLDPGHGATREGRRPQPMGQVRGVP